MKIFAVRDEDNTTNKAVAYLFCYEKEKRFYIELPEEADPWETPLILSSFLKKGQKTINAYWSRIWVQQRIVPSDRQNLGMILRDNGLDFYDEYKLLTMTNGRCSQDSYYLEPISEKDIPKEFVKRNQQKVEDVIPLPENQLLVFFRDSSLSWQCCRTGLFCRSRCRCGALSKTPAGCPYGRGLRTEQNLLLHFWTSGTLNRTPPYLLLSEPGKASATPGER